MAVAMSEGFLDQAIRVLNGEGLQQEKAIATQQGIPEQFTYVPLELEDGMIYLALEKGASAEQIEAAKEHVITEKATWTAAYVNDLPDSSFAYIESGGEKDDDGKTTPRSKRHLPYKDKDGQPDEAHVRNALSRLPQTDIPDAAKSKAKKKLAAAAKELGVEVSDDKSEPETGEEKVWADPEGERFDITTPDTLKAAMVEVGDAVIRSELSQDQQAAIFKAMGERKKFFAEQPSDPPKEKNEGGEHAEKDVTDTFAEFLDTAMDNALVDAISGVYYAFVRTYAGSLYYGYGEGRDPDTLTSEEFAALVGAMGEAMVMVYAKLADGDETAQAEAQAQAATFTKHGILGLVQDGIDNAEEPVEKAGKRHNKHDEARMEIMHGALTGLGYSGCVPKSDEDGDASSEGDADEDDAGKKQQKSEGVTGSGSTDALPEPKDVTEAQKQIKDLTAELETVKAESKTSESELSRVKDEQRQRIESLEATLQEKTVALERFQSESREDPLNRTPERVPVEKTEGQTSEGTRKAFTNMTREIRRR
jgi:hypothetical protein